MRGLDFICIIICIIISIVRCTPKTPNTNAASKSYTSIQDNNNRSNKLHPNTYIDSTASKSHPDGFDQNASLNNNNDILLVIKYKIAVTARCIYLLVVFMPVFITGLFAFPSIAFRHSIWYKLLAYSVGISGAAFIKWGQWASTRTDIFPDELCYELAQLQANAPIHSLHYTRQQILLELGGSIEELFSSFDTKPIASGSIAQVYKAVYNSRPVAVKVRHPGVEQQIKMDFDIMKTLASFIEKLPGLSWLNLSQSMAQFSKTIASQVRLDIEGDHLDEFNRNFNSWSDVHFPLPIIKTHSILVESFIGGVSAAKVSEMILHARAAGVSEQYEELAYFIVTKGTNLYLKMLLEDNLMHADLHPGNILVELSQRKDASSNGDMKTSAHNNQFEVFELDKHNHFENMLRLFHIPSFSLKYNSDNKQYKYTKRKAIDYKLSLVDAGMVARLTSEEQENFIGFIESLGEGNGINAANCVLKFSSNSEVNENADLFRIEMKNMFAEICRGYYTNVDLGAVFRGLLSLIRKYQISIESNYATLVMNCLCLEALAKSILPTYNILDGAKPLLTTYKRLRIIPGSLKIPFIKLVIPFFLQYKSWKEKLEFHLIREKEVKKQLKLAAEVGLSAVKAHIEKTEANGIEMRLAEEEKIFESNTQSHPVNLHARL
eukprot:gene5215-7256_t